MTLPFGHDQFLDVFGAYNSVLWPAVVLLWIVTTGVVFGWLSGRRVDGRVLFALLAVHWAWSGIAYHWAFFRSTNPAAPVFAAMFILQAALFTRIAFVSRAYAQAGFSVRGVAGGALVIYGLLYPLVGLFLGLESPRLPLFAVPCPTTLVTAGLLVTSVGVPRSSNVLPFLWAVVGSSAAFSLGIRADMALIVAGAVLALDLLAPAALGARVSGRSTTSREDR